MQSVKLVPIVFILLSITYFSPAMTSSVMPLDSIGKEVRNGQTFILHKVSKGETLYGLSRRYNVSVNTIEKHNPGSKKGLKFDQVLSIPYKAKQSPKPGTTIHTVLAGETLYGISRKYGVSVDQLKKWNDLSSTSLNEGQKLTINAKGQSKPKETVVAASASGQTTHTVAQNQTLYGISKLYGVSVNDIKQWNQLSGSSLKIGQQLVIKDQAVPVQETASIEETSSSSNTDSNGDFKSYDESMEESKRVNNEARTVSSSKTNVSSFKKVVEIGFAERIKTDKQSKKWLALHATAPVGTIIRVKNEMNNLWVFVRVVGPLTDTSANDKVLIKISQTAYEKLGAIDERFPVEISYVP